MNYASLFHETVLEQLRRIEATRMPGIEKAAEFFAGCLLNSKWIYVFGTGHSHMLAEELFYRAGGMARIRPILHTPLMLHESASASTYVERDLDIVDDLLASYPVADGDVLLIASNSGRNPVPVELAAKARERGARVVALINRKHCAAFDSRHPSGKKLPDFSDLSIDNCGVVGDACVTVDERRKIGAASTVTGATILQMIACRSVQLALERGWEAELFASSNAGGEEGNDALVERVRRDVKHL